VVAVVFVMAQFRRTVVSSVRSDKTQIAVQPRTLSVDKLHDAKFNCTSTTDVEEIHLLQITWSHDGRPISNDSRHHVTQTMTSQGGIGRLRIYGVGGADNGQYACTATSGLDTAVSQPADLLVKGLNHTHTHAHTHTFNGPLSRTARESRYQKGKTNLDFTEARDSEWQWY